MKYDTKGWFFKALGLLGLVAILVVGAWGVIRVVTSLPSVFSKVSSTVSPAATILSEEKVDVTAPAGAVSSGNPFTLAWSHRNADGEHAYSVSYACREGLSITSPLPNGKEQSVPCATPFNFTNAQDSLRVTPTVAGAAAINVPFTVTATGLASGGITASSEYNVTVLAPEKPLEKPAEKPAVPTKTSPTAPTQTTTTYYIPGTNPSDPNGVTDLDVRVISTGTVSSNGSYAPNALVTLGSRAAVQFEIRNSGTKTTPLGWTFSAALPTGYTFTSNPQQIIVPGGSVVYTLGFDGIGGQNFACYQNPNYPYNSYCPQNTNCYYPQGSTYPYNNCLPNNQSVLVTITADPDRYVAELNRGNNAATASFTILYR